MAYNGSGTFTRNQDWTADRDSGNPGNIISATKMDDEDDNFKAGFDAVLTRDGQGSATANLPMNTFKHTGVGNATTRTDYAVTSQVQDSDYIDAGTSSGADTITVTLTPTLTAYAVGQVFSFVAGDTNTGAVTLNIDTVGALAIQKLGAALVAGDITTGDVVQVRHDGTQLQMLTPARTPVFTAGAIATAAVADNAIDETKLKDALIPDFTEVVVVAGDSILLSDADDSGNSKRDTVQGILDLVPADLLGKADTVITASDKVIFGDATDSDNPKTDTVQGILDLVPSDGRAKAWVTFNTITTTAILESFNITSVADNGTGDTTVTIATDFATADYAIAAVCDIVTSANQAVVTTSTRTVGAVRVTTRGSENTAVQDCNYVSLIMMGTQ